MTEQDSDTWSLRDRIDLALHYSGRADASADNLRTIAIAFASGVIGFLFANPQERLTGFGWVAVAFAIIALILLTWSFWKQKAKSIARRDRATATNAAEAITLVTDLDSPKKEDPKKRSFNIFSGEARERNEVLDLWALGSIFVAIVLTAASFALPAICRVVT